MDANADAEEVEAAVRVLVAEQVTEGPTTTTVSSVVALACHRVNCFLSKLT